MTKKAAALFVLAASTCPAQSFSAGVKAGLPLTNFIATLAAESAQSTDRYLVGPTAEVHLPYGWGIEVDAIYRHFDYSNVYRSGVVGLSALLSANTAGAWEFPVLAKYRFPGRLLRPYVDAGVAWDRITGLTNTFTVITNPPLPPPGNPSGERHRITVGAVLGAGVDIHMRIHIMPEVRYTRWTNQHFEISNVLHSNQSQAELMVGFSF